MITKGICETSKHATPDYAPQYGVYLHNEHNDFCTVKSKNAKDDADFIADAFNTYNETGLTPSQLAEHRTDLLAACKNAVDLFEKIGTRLVAIGRTDIIHGMPEHEGDKHGSGSSIDKIRQAIAKAEVVVAVAPDTECDFKDDCIFYNERNGAGSIKCLDCVRSNSIQDDKLDHYEDDWF